MTMPDYEVEAARYDESRGGQPRARAAATAIETLLPAGPVLDVAVGTGIVAAAMARPVIGVDLSSAMLGHASRRLPGRVARADARSLPVASDSVSAVTAIWLLHLMPDSEAVVREVARVLRRGGVFVCTVDKRAAHRLAEGNPALPGARDERSRVEALGARYGLAVSGEGSFVGYGQDYEPVFPLLALTKKQ
ncbi:class I SAM-dependent methyltransferase [Allokutzneria oryzae]|uniref:Class I SAM-dependent methyltransferase n=1 Tax=Allokutzneria oryzae TaxID=1378989 RepID=A0ABV5ZW94_9PSEU